MLDAFLLGMIMILVYDLIRIFRRIIPHGVLAVSFEDLLFWFFCASSVFALLYYENNGAFRWFAVLGVAGGMGIYHLIVKDTLVETLSEVINWLFEKIGKLTAFLGRPFVKAGKTGAKEVKKGGRLIARSARWYKKQLTLRMRMLKILLYKHSERKKGNHGKEKDRISYRKGRTE